MKRQLSADKYINGSVLPDVIRGSGWTDVEPPMHLFQAEQAVSLGPQR